MRKNLDKAMSGKNILLIEPGYKNKYPPLGLMKIAQYHGERGKNDHVCFIKGEDESVLQKHWDRIYITTLFSFEYKRIAESIDFALKAVGGNADKVFVGGIAASLMRERFTDEPRWSGVRFIQGLLDKDPATSLQLDHFSNDLYADDTEGMPIEDHIPDYSILDQIDYQYPVSDAYFTYASRGCTRKCAFCGVPKLEGDLRETQSLSRIIDGVAELYGEKKDLILMDNNVTAAPRYKEIIAEIRDLGFQAGAKLKRNGRSLQRRVDFNQGVDARILCKSPHFLQEMATICIKPLRIAFDHGGLRKPYEQAVRYAFDAGITELSNYMLYNFHDSPQDLFARMRLNVALNEELRIRIFSFPMRYQPTNQPHRRYVGEKWNIYWLRSMQIILQATHGIVSGNPAFFKTAFGDSYDDFEDLLFQPHVYTFNRAWYTQYGGREEYDEFCTHFSKLSPSQKDDLKSALDTRDSKEREERLFNHADKKIRDLHHFYRKVSSQEEMDIWEKMKAIKVAEDLPSLPDDERVEDAGIAEESDDS